MGHAHAPQSTGRTGTSLNHTLKLHLIHQPHNIGWGMRMHPVPEQAFLPGYSGSMHTRLWKTLAKAQAVRAAPVKVMNTLSSNDIHKPLLACGGHTTCSQP